MSLCNCAHSVECLHWHNIPASPLIDAGFPIDIIFYHQHSWFSLLISLSILALSKVMWCSKQTMLRLPRKINLWDIHRYLLRLFLGPNSMLNIEVLSMGNLKLCFVSGNSMLRIITRLKYALFVTSEWHQDI